MSGGRQRFNERAEDNILATTVSAAAGTPNALIPADIYKAGKDAQDAALAALTSATDTKQSDQDALIAALQTDTHAHTNKTLLDAIASLGGIAIVGQTLTLTKADGTDQSITLPDQVELTRPEPAPTVPDPATATPGTVYVVAGDGAYMVNDAADTMIKVADIATIETMTQAHIDAPDGVGRLVTPELLLSRDFITTIDTQAEAETTTIMPGRAGLIGSMPGAENPNYLGTWLNITKVPQLLAVANRVNPAIFIKIHGWRGSLFVDNSGDSPGADKSSLYYKDWTIGVLPEPPREQSHLYTGQLSHTKAQVDAMTTAAELQEVHIDWTFYSAVKLSNDTLAYVADKDHDHDADNHILDKINVHVRSGGTNAGSSFTLSFDDIDGNTYAHADWLVSGTLTQYAGGTATIVLDRMPWTGGLGLGRNKEGTLSFQHVGSNPNGLSKVNYEGANGANSDGVIDVRYLLSNENDSFPSKASVTPIKWTTVPGPQATDQAAYWEPDREYLVGEIFSHTEEDATTPDPLAGEIFNWRVTTQIDANEFATWDGTNYATVQGRLERFAVGAPPAEEVVWPGAGLPVNEKHNKYWSDETAPDLAWLQANAAPTSAEQTLSVSQYTVTKAVYQALSTTDQDTHKPPVTLYTSVESTPGVFRWTEHESGGGGDGLRGDPVADAATLTALIARDYERRKLLDTGKEYVFEAGRTPVTGDLADDAATGAWVDQTLTPGDSVAPSMMVGNRWMWNRTDPVPDHLLPLNGQVIDNVDVDRPVLWSVRNVSTLISSFDDTAKTITLKDYNGQGRFARAGAAAGVEQSDATAVNGLRTFRTYVQSDWNGQSNNDFSKGSGSPTGAANNSTGLSSSDTETRPINVSEIWCIIAKPWVVAGDVTINQASTEQILRGVRTINSAGTIDFSPPFKTGTVPTLTGINVSTGGLVRSLVINTISNTSANVYSIESDGTTATGVFHWMAVGEK